MLQLSLWLEFRPRQKGNGQAQKFRCRQSLCLLNLSCG